MADQVKPLMPHATATWLVDNTGLSFEQIAEFCGLHILEVQAMADDLAGSKYTGRVVQGPGGGSARHLHVKYDELHEVADERKLLCEKVLRSQAQILCEPSRAIRAREHAP